MTKKRLEAHRSKKQEIEELKWKLRNMESKDYIDNSVIMDYRSGFPIPQSVIGVDTDAYRKRQKRLRDEISRLERHCQEVEQWIEDIPDSLTRRIFRMYYEDGQNQKVIAKQLHVDRSTISKKINNYLQET